MFTQYTTSKTILNDDEALVTCIMIERKLMQYQEKNIYAQETIDQIYFEPLEF